MTERGWYGDDNARERTLNARPGGFEAETVTVADVAGRTVAVFGGRSDDRLPVCTVDVETGEPLPDRALVHGRWSPGSIALGRCGDRVLLATGTRQGSVRVRDAHTGAPVGVEISHDRTGVSIAVASVGGEDVVAVAGSAWIKAWRLADGAQLASRGYRKVRFAGHGGRLLAVQDRPGGLRETRDVLTGKVVAAGFRVPDEVVWTLTTHAGRLLALGPHGDATWAWDVLAGTPVTLPPLVGPGDLDDDADTVRDVRVAEVDGDLATLVTWYTTGMETGRTLLHRGRRVPLGPEPMGAIAALGAGLVAEAGFHHALTVRDAATGTPIETPYYGGEVRAPDGAGVLDGRAVAVLPGVPLMVWDIADGRPVARVDAGVDPQRVAVGDGVAALLHPRDGEEPRLRLVDLATGEIRADVPVDPGYAALAVTPVFLTYRGRSVVAVAGTGMPGPISLFDAVTGERQDTVFRLDSGASVLATGRIGDRAVLAAGADFGGVRIWDADSGAELLSLIPEGFRVRAIALGDRHGRPIVATATEQYGRVQVFDAINGEQIGRGVDIGRRWPPVTVTSLRIIPFRGRTAVLAAPPRLFVV